MQTIKKQYGQFFPGNAFEYFFLDEQFSKQYATEAQTQRLLALFSGLVVLVAAMGLFALTAYSVSRRTKEIGIRKVLGASVGQITALLSSTLLRLQLLSLVLAWPLAYWAIERWLENYPFRMQIHPGLFLLPAVLVTFISLLAVSRLTFQAARANPVDSLRYE
jgi:putative ABC transport system permease protein